MPEIVQPNVTKAGGPNQLGEDAVDVARLQRRARRRVEDQIIGARTVPRAAPSCRAWT